MRLWLLFIAAILSAFSVAGSIEDKVLQTEIRFQSRPKAEDSLLAAIAVDNGHTETGFSEELFSELVTTQLFAKGISASKVSGSWVRRLEAGSVPLSQAISPKFIIDIRVRSENHGLVASCDAALVSYKLGTRSAKAHRRWSRNRQISGPLASRLQDDLILCVQTAVSEAAQLIKRDGRLASRLRGRKNIEPKVGMSESQLTYNARWNDPDTRRNNFFVGASVGTPAIFNLHVGYWGSAKVPFVATLSGMYIDTKHRGFQVEAGWLIDNEGSFKHGFGGTASWLVVESATTNVQTDVIGRVSSVETESVVQPGLFVGPSYFFDFHHIRAQVGVAFPVSGTLQSGPRLLFQVGFVPPLEM